MARPNRNVSTTMLAMANLPAPPPVGPAGSPVGPSTTTFLTAAVPCPGPSVKSSENSSDLTNLGWLQKPGVLASMCTALTGSPHRVSKAGSRAMRRPRGGLSLSCGDRRRAASSGSSATAKDSDKMVNVILNVRNRKYNGEDSQKPPLSFACMIFMAVESSPTKTLPVKEIYEWIMWKFPYYRTAAPGWKNSVRHNLSLNKCFRKVDRGSSKVMLVRVRVLERECERRRLKKESASLAECCFRVKKHMEACFAFVVRLVNHAWP